MSDMIIQMIAMKPYRESRDVVSILWNESMYMQDYN